MKQNSEFDLKICIIDIWMRNWRLFFGFCIVLMGAFLIFVLTMPTFEYGVLEFHRETNANYYTVTSDSTYREGLGEDAYIDFGDGPVIKMFVDLPEDEGEASFEKRLIVDVIVSNPYNESVTANYYNIALDGQVLPILVGNECYISENAAYFYNLDVGDEIVFINDNFYQISLIESYDETKNGTVLKVMGILVPYESNSENANEGMVVLSSDINVNDAESKSEVIVFSPFDNGGTTHSENLNSAIAKLIASILSLIIGVVIFMAVIESLFQRSFNKESKELLDWGWKKSKLHIWWLGKSMFLYLLPLMITAGIATKMMGDSSLLVSKIIMVTVFVVGVLVSELSAIFRLRKY